MSKILLALSFVCLIVLIVGTTLFPESSLFWLATSGTTYQHLREVMALVLLLQLFTRPPRHILFRIASGMLALSAGVWALEATYSNHMMFLDSMSFLAASFAIGITALELRSSAQPATSQAS